MTGLVHADARLIDTTSGRVRSGGELHAEAARVADSLTALAPGVVFARTGIDQQSILRYLGAFSAHRAVALLDPDLDNAVLAELITRFRPAAVLGVDAQTDAPTGYHAAELDGLAWLRADASAVAPHPDLAVLLATSGSTGNPKLVRLSRAAVLANARSIADALRLDADEVAPTSLPLHYSYGLSVLNSHLVTGATVLIQGSGVLGRPFWQAVEEHKATSLAGVPYHYEMLRRLKFEPAKYPSLRTLTQAGGKLRTERIAEFADKMRAVGGRLYVMYGQTEATARMAILPADRLDEKLGSAGQAIPGGEFTIRAAAGGGPAAESGGSVDHEASGEVIYRGPNVMMGYAETEAELAAGDQLGGVLATGDLGYLDADGFLFITGRLKRIGKIFGTRVNLDDIEHLLRGHAPAAAVPGEDKVVIRLEGADSGACRAAAKSLAEQLHLHVSGFDVRGIDALPLLASGKINYRALEGL